MRADRQTGSCARSNAQSSRTCCSFIAEACARQTAPVRLFPDVCSLLSTSLSLFPLFLLSSPTGLHLTSNSPQHPPPFRPPVCHQLWAQHTLSLVGYTCDTDKNSLVCLGTLKSALDPENYRQLWAVVGGYLPCWEEIPLLNSLYSASTSSLVNTHPRSPNQSVLMFITSHLFKHLMSYHCLSHTHRYHSYGLSFHQHSTHIHSLLCSPVALVSLQDLAADTHTHRHTHSYTWFW